MKKLKEKGIGGIVSMVIYILMGAVIGFHTAAIFDGMGLLNGGTKGALLFFVLMLYIYASMIIQVIVHEGGHLVAGLLSGYKFLSFRVFNIIWVRNNEKTEMKKYTIPGTAGQCLMWPCEYNGGEFPYLLYNLGGGIMNIVFSTVLLCVSGLFRSLELLWLFVIFLSYCGFAMALINLIPMKVGGMSNDGKNISDMRKDENIRNAFWRELYINALLSTGKRYSELDEWLFDTEGLDTKNPIAAYIHVINANRHLENGQYEKAYEIFDKMLEGDSPKVSASELSVSIERSFLMMMLGKSREDVESSVTSYMKKYMKSAKILPQVKRFEYAYELYVNGDIQNTLKKEAEFEKVLSNSPNIGDNLLEKQLFLEFKEKYFAKYSESEYNDI